MKVFERKSKSRLSQPLLSTNDRNSRRDTYNSESSLPFSREMEDGSESAIAAMTDCRARKNRMLTASRPSSSVQRKWVSKSESLLIDARQQKTCVSDSEIRFLSPRSVNTRGRAFSDRQAEMPKWEEPSVDKTSHSKCGTDDASRVAMRQSDSRASVPGRNDTSKARSVPFPSATLKVSARSEIRSFPCSFSSTEAGRIKPSVAAHSLNPFWSVAFLRSCRAAESESTDEALRARGAGQASFGLRCNQRQRSLPGLLPSGRCAGICMCHISGMLRIREIIPGIRKRING